MNLHVSLALDSGAVADSATEAIFEDESSAILGEHLVCFLGIQTEPSSESDGFCPGDSMRTGKISVK